MAEMSTIVEGNVKYRDGKKWKPRWCVMKKPSPVADRLIVYLYKDVKESIKGCSPKCNFPLDGFYGLESGICYDKETSVLAIICHKQITLLAFDSRETLIQFEIKIRRSLGEEHQFPVRIIKVPNHSKLPLDLLRMHIHGQRFCLTGHIPPKILGSWQISELRRFGAIDGKFCFEGGSRCGKGEGCHVLQTDQVEDISEIISHASVGKSASLIKRHTSKRRSEFLDPVKQSVSDTVFKKFENRPVFADQNYQDDNSWPRYKRHSISFTDYRRAKTYAEKQRLHSIENVEKERLMAIYDVPPRRIRKVETSPLMPDNRNCSPRYDPNVRSYDVNFNALRNYNAESTQGNENYLNWAGEYNNNVMCYQVPRPIANAEYSNNVVTYQVPRPTASAININQSDAPIYTSIQSDSTSSHGSIQSIQSVSTPVNQSSQLSQQTSVSLSTSAPALFAIDTQAFTSHYKDISQSVPNQIAEEIDAQRDEVMRSLDQSEQDLEKEMSLLDEMLQVCHRTEQCSEEEEERGQQPPPLPVKLSQLRGPTHPDARGSLDNLSISSDNTHCRSSPRSAYANSVLLSPNLLNKLQKIPRKSKMNAPLPYVNLSKYDGDYNVNHVHVPAAPNSAPDGGSAWCEFQRVRSKGYDNVQATNRVSVSEDNNKRASLSLPGSHENLKNIAGPDYQVDGRKRNASFSNEEPIYANERCITPPPELPPKGPHIRSKQRPVITAASRPPAPPRLPDRQRQMKSRSQYSSPQIPANHVSLNSSQDDYFLMGNFDREPTHCKIDYTDAHRRNHSWSTRQVVNLPPRDKNSTKMSPADCYIDMTGIMELDKSKPGTVNPDASPKCASRPRYSRSLSASGIVVATPGTQSPVIQKTPARPESVSISAGNSPKEARRETPIREENYMLMSSVSPRRPPAMENQRTIQEYVNASQIEASIANSVSEDPLKKQLTFTGTDSNDSSRVDDSVLCEDSQSSADVSHMDGPNVEMPFENLIDFTQPAVKNLDKTSVQSNASSSDKTENSSGGKTPGFFSRLMRRNSKDRKSVSQSHENLLSSSASEPVIKEDSASSVSENSSSDECSRAQSQQDLGLLEPKDHRNRSSSFPNRSIYNTMNNESNSSSSTGISILSQQSDLGATNSSLNSCETVSTHASSNEGNLNDSLNTSEQVLSDSDRELSMGNYEQHSYLFLGPLHSPDRETNQAMVPCEAGEQTVCSDKTVCRPVDQTDECKMEEGEVDKGKQCKPEQNVDKVFTVLNVQGGHFDQNLCKTDDEKLIDLWHSTHSLDSGKTDKISDLKSKMTLPLDEMSPDEKASAIARHISSLPPFVPPKMKSYPAKLSPVLERSSPKVDKPEPLNISQSGTSGEKLESPVLSPSLMKQQAKATLRITPPSEDEHGKIWIPRTSQEETYKEASVHTESEAAAQKTGSLVVDVTDLVESDSLSMSSLDSYSCQIIGEEFVRSSPASTILRPRSGKEYQKVERRRTLEDSNATSPLTTPQSPANGSVFTFDNLATTGSTGGQQGELQSPKLLKPGSHSEQASICASVRSERIPGPRAMYMNIDFTGDNPAPSPPESPGLAPVGMEQVEPMLNYAEIDLSDAGKNENASNQAWKLNYAEMDLTSGVPERRGGSQRQKKGKKVPEPIPIEYSMIDMVATRAAQKARKEHAISRDGSLRRDRSSNTLTTKERVASLSSKSERKQTPASAAGQSTCSVDSTTF